MKTARRTQIWILATVLGSVGISPSLRGFAAADAPAESRHNRPRAFVGELVEISAADGFFSAQETLNSGAHKITKFQVTAHTRIMRGKDSCRLEDLRPNDHVTIKYADGSHGEKHALTVRVTPSAPASPPK